MLHYELGLDLFPDMSTKDRTIYDEKTGEAAGPRQSYQSGDFINCS